MIHQTLRLSVLSSTSPRHTTSCAPTLLENISHRARPWDSGGAERPPAHLPESAPRCCVCFMSLKGCDPAEAFSYVGFCNSFTLLPPTLFTLLLWISGSRSLMRPGTVWRTWDIAEPPLQSFWFSRSEREPENLHSWQVPRYRGHRRSMIHGPCVENHPWRGFLVSLHHESYTFCCWWHLGCFHLEVITDNFLWKSLYTSFVYNTYHISARSLGIAGF